MVIRHSTTEVHVEAIVLRVRVIVLYTVIGDSVGIPFAFTLPLWRRI